MLPSPQPGGPPLVGCTRLLIQYIRSYPPYRRQFLHPKPADAPCRGDREPLIMAFLLCTYVKYLSTVRKTSVKSSDISG
jgi:hypothetical protein